MSIRTALLSRHALKVLPFLALTSCITTEFDTPGPGGNDLKKVDEAHAEKVVEAARQVLGHDVFTVCYVDGTMGALADATTNTLSAVMGPSNLVRSTAAGLEANYTANSDVVVDGPNTARADRTLTGALKLVGEPMPGLDIVLQAPPSAELQLAAAKAEVRLHTIAKQ